MGVAEQSLESVVPARLARQLVGLAIRGAERAGYRAVHSNAFEIRDRLSLDLGIPRLPIGRHFLGLGRIGAEHGGDIEPGVLQLVLAVAKAPTSQPARVNATQGAGCVTPARSITCGVMSVGLLTNESSGSVQ